VVLSAFAAAHESPCAHRDFTMTDPSAPTAAQASAPTSGNGKKRAPRSSRPDLQNRAVPVDANRPLPHSLDAEQALISSILLSPDKVLPECIERIGEDSSFFHLPAHGTIYEVLTELWENKKPIDLITVTDSLREKKLLDQVGGPGTIATLYDFVPTAANAAFYLDILYQKRLLRKVILTCTECAARAYEPDQEVHDFIDSVEQQIFQISQTRRTGEVRTMREEVLDAIQAIEKLLENRGGITGLPTGFKDLDRMTSGLHPAEMFVIAARPSMGKTALAMNIAEHVGVVEKKAVAIFSLEMSTGQLVQRLLCSLARVDLAKARDGFLSDRDFQSLMAAAQQLIDSQILIDDTAALSINELRAKARRLKTQHDIQLIVIDYLQLLRSTSRRAQDNRQQEISEISNGIKAVAKELKIPVVVLAQLNRNPENRPGNKPRLSDLRESGAIEQDADVVGLLVRSEYYGNDDEDGADRTGEAELIIAKQRNGPTGEIPLTFLKQFTRFEDRARTAGPDE
jgi:replicative DNA helicase